MLLRTIGAKCAEIAGKVARKISREKSVLGDELPNAAKKLGEKINPEKDTLTIYTRENIQRKLLEIKLTQDEADKAAKSQAEVYYRSGGRRVNVADDDNFCPPNHYKGKPDVWSGR